MSRGSRWAAALIVVLGAAACQIIAGIDDRELAQPPTHPGTGGTPNVGTGGTPNVGTGGTPNVGVGGSIAMGGSSGTGGAGGTADLEGGTETGTSDAPEEVADVAPVGDAPGETAPDAEQDAGDASVDQGADAADAPPSDETDGGITTDAADAADSGDTAPEADAAAEASPTDGGSG